MTRPGDRIRDAGMVAVTMTGAPAGSSRALPPVLGRLLRGTFWLALRTPLQVVFAFWSVPLIQHAIGKDLNGAYVFAWGFGFLQFLLEFGMSSALQRQVAESWTRGDRRGVDRAVACGASFYATMALVQVAALLGIAYLAVPHSGYDGEGRRLIVKLLWLQALTAPCFGLSVVFSSVLQAARRYEVIPKCELLILVTRFVVLVGGLRLGFGIFPIVAAQTFAQVALSLGPEVWIVVRELGIVPKLGGVGWADFAPLLKVSVYVFLIQLSVVLADRLDTTVLGFALEDGAGPATTIYWNVSKPFSQIRQTGWMLSYMVMPAVASLAAAGDRKGLERIKYDGSRLLIGALLPIALLAALYAHPFLALWIDPPMAENYRLLQLFLVATLPLLLAVLVQMAIGMGKIEVIALAALVGALVNLPISYALTRRIGVAGVIWGTVLTTLFSNLLVPGVYCFRVLEVRVGTFLRRTLGAPLVGAVALLVATRAFGLVVAPEPPGPASRLDRAPTFLAHLAVGVLAYAIGYVATPTGRGDLSALWRRVGGRRGGAVGGRWSVVGEERT